MADPEFYPALSTLVPVESIPPNLGFVQGILRDVLDRLFYRDLQFQKSRLGDAGFYHLSVVIYRRLGVEIPGTGGAALVLNPGQEDGKITEIPVGFSYRWDILKYVTAFDQASAAELPRLAFDAFVEMSGVSSAGLLAELIDQLHGSASDPVQAFVDAYNLDNLPTVPLARLNNPDPDTVIEDLLGQLDDVQEISVYELVFTTLLSSATNLEATFEQIAAFFGRWVKDLSLDDFTDFLLPHGAVAIQDLELALEFPRALLKPVNAKGEVVDADSTAPEEQKAKSRLTFTAGSLRYSTDAGFQFDALNTFKFDRSQIGNTGIVIGFKDMKLDLSRTTNIPEATADGRPLDFVGAYVKEAEIELPKKWFPQSNPSTSATKIVGQNIIIGTGGLSGKVTFKAGGVLHTKLGNFAAELEKFDLRFERNAIVESNISGRLTLAGFKDGAGNKDAQISIEAHLAEDGDFSVTAKEPQGILVTIPDVLKFKIFTLGFGREDERFFVSTSGTATLTVLDKIPALKTDRPIAVELKKLLIWEDGRIEIEGGTIILPQALTLKIGPVKLSVTAISMGAYTRDGRPYKYFGFDGGVNVNPGGADVRANGVKVYYSTDDKPLDVFVRVEGIAVDIVIPGGKSADEATVLISGFLQMKEPDPNAAAGTNTRTEYAGGVSFKMPKAGIGGSAAMRLNPSLPSFIIDAELSISVPIPLGNTSLGIYGFRGLIGFRYVADREYIQLDADAEWYQYYKKKLPPTNKEGISVVKFEPRPGFAVGAGLTFGTLTDSGKAFSAKLFLLLSLPDALLLQGQAAVMGERVDLSPNDPPFSVFIAITKQSVEAAFGVDYKLPEGSGEILDLHALVEMGFFFNDSTAWYVNAGRDLPASKRITARLFTLFDAWSYLMLSSRGIKAGAGVGWDFNKGFGPLQVEAHAYLDTRGQISFKPKQIGAAVLLGGSASVRIFKFKLGLSIAAGLAAEAPSPFIVTGSVAVRVDLPWPFRKLGGTFTLDFTWTFVPFDLNREAKAVPVFNESDVGEAAKVVSLATRERFDVNVLPAAFVGTAAPPPPTSDWLGNFDHFVVPLDATVDVELKKPIAPGPGLNNIGVTGTGYANTEIVPPQRGKSPQVQHRYVVDEVKIRAWNPDSKQWEDYDVYAALTPLAHAPFIAPADLMGLKQGWWQVDQPGRVNKLSLLAQTPLSYANDVAGPFVPENSGVSAQTIFCPDTPIADRCLVVDEWRDLKSLTADRRYTWNGVHVRVIGKDGQVVPFLNAFGLKHGVALKPESQLEIFFPEATGRVTLRLATLADDVTVRYQQRRQVSEDGSQQPVYSYVTVRQDVLKAANLLRPVTYDAVGVPIQKVVVSAGRCRCADMAAPALMPAAALSRLPGETSDAPESAPPPCGSVQAYLANVCSAAQQQLAGLQQQHDQLVTQAAEYQLLATQMQDGACDPTLTPRYEQLANALVAEAKALQAEIDALAVIGRCCRGRGHATADCNLDPKVDYACLSVVFGVCWLPVGDQLFNATIPSFSSLLASNNAMVKAINRTIHPLWRPDTIYAVSIRTTDNVSVSEKGHAAATATYMHLGFRTRGPLGHFHQHRDEYKDLVAQDRSDEFRLQSLKPYIDFATSYPRADGNVLNAKPLFYVNPELRVFYVHQYVYTMYGGQFDHYHGNPAVKSTLEVSILDPVDPLPKKATDPGHLPPVSLELAANTLGRRGLDLQLLDNMATQGDSCTAAGQASGIAPLGIQSNVKVDRLKPRKLYLAVFKARYEDETGVHYEEVHRYNFQTSRYADFAEQVNSYRLKDANGAFSRDAVYDDVVVTLDPARSAQLAVLLGGGAPTGDPLERDYADPFDRLMDGVLHLGPLDPPVNTDFTIVRDGANDQVIGILVRSPEPFNDPGIPAADVATTIVLSQPGAPVAAFTTLHAKDRSRAFVGAVDLDLALNDLTFRFTYLEYDGVAYVPASVVEATLFAGTPQ